MELMWLGVNNIGAYVPPDVISGTIVGAALGIMGGGDTAAAIALAVAIGIPTATLVQQLNILVMTTNVSLVHGADTVSYTHLTCAPEGRLAVESEGDDDQLTLLIPRANDKGFAMTGSYSCMTLLSTLIFDTASLEQKTAWVEAAAKLGEDVVARESEIAEFLSGDFNRVTYLGSGSFVGLAQEAQLKICLLYTSSP